MASSLFNIHDAPHYGAVGTKASITITPKGDGFGCYLLLIKRAAIGLHALISYDYWQNAYDVISGVVPQNIVLTKNAASGAITITNNTGATIAFLFLE